MSSSAEKKERIHTIENMLDGGIEERGILEKYRILEHIFRCILRWEMIFDKRKESILVDDRKQRIRGVYL